MIIIFISFITVLCHIGNVKRNCYIIVLPNYDIPDKSTIIDKRLRNNKDFTFNLASTLNPLKDYT